MSIIIGPPSGYYLTAWLFEKCLDDNFDFGVHINISTYIIATVVTFFVAYIVSKFLARKINKIAIQYFFAFFIFPSYEQ